MEPIINYTTPIFAEHLFELSDEPSLSFFNTRSIAVFLLLSTTSLLTVFGNVLVVVSIWREIGLHSPTNYFIASLAGADLLVGGIVIPFEAVTELLSGKWLFGPLWCDLWRALDVLLATSSILNLSVISLDRYWAISEPFAYPRKMTPATAGKFISGVWLCSVAISLPAIIYWRWTRESPFPLETCLFTEDPIYLLVSSTISFYLPLAVMLFTYFRIYRAAVRQTRSIKMGGKLYYDRKLEIKNLPVRMHRGGLSNNHRPSSFTGSDILVSPTRTGNEESPKLILKCRSSVLRRKINKFSNEKKAAQTLFIIIGVFVFCWMPFFVLNTWAGICPECEVQQSLTFSLFTWLGWLNSAMNPAIYAARNPDFRRAFVRILGCCRFRRKSIL